MEYWSIQDQDGNESIIFDQEFTNVNTFLGLIGLGLCFYPFIMIGLWIYDISGNDVAGVVGGFISLAISLILLSCGRWVIILILYLVTLVPFIMMIYDWWNSVGTK